MLLGNETIDLDERDEEILDRVWDQIAAEERQVDRDARRPARRSGAPGS